MPSERTKDALWAVFALPIYQVANLVKYAQTKKGLVAKIGTVLCFIPIIAITTTCWATAWVVAVWLTIRVID